MDAKLIDRTLRLLHSIRSDYPCPVCDMYITHAENCEYASIIAALEAEREKIKDVKLIEESDRETEEDDYPICEICFGKGYLFEYDYGETKIDCPKCGGNGKSNGGRT